MEPHHVLLYEAAIQAHNARLAKVEADKLAWQIEQTRQEKRARLECLAYLHKLDPSIPDWFDHYVAPAPFQRPDENPNPYSEWRQLEKKCNGAGLPSFNFYVPDLPGDLCRMTLIVKQDKGMRWVAYLAGNKGEFGDGRDWESIEVDTFLEALGAVMADAQKHGKLDV